MEEFKREMKTLTVRLKEAENRAEQAEKQVKRLQKEVDRLEGAWSFEFYLPLDLYIHSKSVSLFDHYLANSHPLTIICSISFLFILRHPFFILSWLYIFLYI